MKQANLFPLSQPIEPAPDRPEPAMWIRRLLIVESLEPDGRVIRDVTFRLGLNVIRTAERKADETRPVGHSVGKTLLLRLIRYCLGESFFSIRSVRNAIAETLPGAYVLAEICVDGEWWAVARPIGQDHSAGASKAIRGGDAEAVRAGSDEVVKFAEFTAAIEAFAGKRFIEMDFPSAGHPPRWLDLLLLRFADRRSVVRLRTFVQRRSETAPPAVIRSCAIVYASYGLKQFREMRKEAAQLWLNPLADMVRLIERIRNYKEVPGSFAQRLNTFFDVVIGMPFVDMRSLLAARLLSLNGKKVPKQWLAQKKASLAKSKISPFDQALIARSLP